MKGMGRMNKALAGLMVLAMAVVANAAVITETGTQQDGFTDADIATSGLDSSNRDVKESRDNTQTFTTGSVSNAGNVWRLDEIRIAFTGEGNADQAFTLEIFKVDDPVNSNIDYSDETSYPGDDGYELQTTINGVPDPDSGNEVSGTYIIKLGDSEKPLLEENTGYAIRLNTDGDTSKIFQWVYADNNTIEGGARYDDIEQAPDNRTDYAFAVNYTEVPEPATMGLLAIGGLGMLLRRRK